MTPLDTVSQLTAGLRVGLVLLGAMILLVALDTTWATLADRLRARAAHLLATAIVLYSPAHTAWLMGHPVAPLISRSLDLCGTALTCACIIHLLAARGLKRGLSVARVKRGALVNVAVLASIVGAVWLTR